MQRLILMRHGDAERPHGGTADFDRALTPEGRSEARAVGRAMADAGYTPDLALVSSATRALQTWQAFAEACGKARLVEDRSLYLASSARLAAAVKAAAGEGETLILVGHNPGMHQFAVHLARQSGASPHDVRPLYERFPTASAAVFAIGEEGDPRFERLFLAKHYRDKVK